ncbi:hypothetical protein PV10_08211 [Exophiala mesophila]|uniref:DNA replication complex GINS protein PSF1 n=1 Tax=Exophiala mesophila TaxID=212818 RepID=A0A0D1WIB0_EXOME|nr:uncharacterized protein PV10_08211 [Exophiala mesophila]KIV88535.1 hypothetical protein PV10_08211 [Exophiala mesophila]
MHGEVGNKLVQHARRTLTLPVLPAYQTELVRSCVREVRDLDRDVAAILAPFNNTQGSTEDGFQSSSNSFNPAEHPATACALLVDHLSMRRNKRCLLAYHRVRADRVEELVWQGWDPTTSVGDGDDISAGGSRLGNAGDATGTKDSSASPNLSPEEHALFLQYSDLLASYKGQWTDVDLTGSLVPPKDLFIDVRVLKDAGEIQTEYGTLNLTKNSQLHVRLGDVERLIQQGFLKRLN